MSYGTSIAGPATVLAGVTIAAVAAMAWTLSGNDAQTRPVSKAVTAAPSSPVPMPTPTPTLFPRASPTSVPRPSTLSAPNAAPDVVTYTVKRGDSISLISTKTHVPWAVIYAKNYLIIEGAANSNGYTNSRFGSLIFPGETFLLPNPVAS